MMWLFHTESCCYVLFSLFSSNPLNRKHKMQRTTCAHKRKQWHQCMSNTSLHPYDMNMKLPIKTNKPNGVRRHALNHSIPYAP